jgi:hypothetical protein
MCKVQNKSLHRKGCKNGGSSKQNFGTEAPDSLLLSVPITLIFSLCGNVQVKCLDKFSYKKETSNNVANLQQN